MGIKLIFIVITSGGHAVLPLHCWGEVRAMNRRTTWLQGASDLVEETRWTRGNDWMVIGMKRSVS